MNRRREDDILGLTDSIEFDFFSIDFFSIKVLHV